LKDIVYFKKGFFWGKNMGVPVERVTPIQRISKSSDILIAVAVIAVIMTIVIPLPPVIITVLVALNLVISVVTLLISMYTTEPLKFSVFPSLIIVSTVYRLSVNVAVSRSILSAGDAGTLIKMFGSFMTAGNYVVGFIIFIIIMLVTYLVIASGAVRIGEVAARFTLDAMPGKQMAIDADLNAGLITEEEARKRRRNLEKEADFFGAMDGASRFVQRDALAGIIIVIVNVVGGFIIGMVQGKMSWEDALKTYVMLAIGAGISSSIPAVFMSTATGIMVTNAVSEANLGEDITTQFFAHPKVILFGSLILAFLGFIPGVGNTRFLIWLISGAGILLWYTLRTEETRERERILEEEKKVAVFKPPESMASLLQVDTLELEIGYALIPLVDVEQGGDLLDRITIMRRTIALEIGLLVPPIRVRDNMQLQPNEYSIKLKGIEVGRYRILPDSYLAMNPGTVKEEIEGEPTTEPTFGLPAIWIHSSLREQAELLGYTVVDPTSIIITHFSEIIKRNAPEILGRQETQEMINTVKQNYPVVVEELIPNILTLGDVQKVLQNLLRERVSIRDMVTILETLADYGRVTKDIDILTEYVRKNLARSISIQYQKEGKMQVITLDPSLEELLANSLTSTATGTYLNLEPQIIQKIVNSIKPFYEKMIALGVQPIILTSSKIRLPFFRLIEKIFANLVILSYNEIMANLQIVSLGVVSINES
jgi:flagellar biosynthesis protein FlhA